MSVCAADIPQSQAVYDEKYVLLVRRDAASNVVAERVVSRPLAFHADIVDEVRDDFDEADGWQVAGGGIIVVDPLLRRVRTFGKSGGFGAPDRAAVERCLRAAFGSEWQLDVKVTNHVRG